MSDEQRNRDHPADPVVSAAYRELSEERTPAHLDHEVLNMARNAAKERHRSAMAWLRPAAWVATVGLCLAIVLEVANLPLQEQADTALEATAERVPEAGMPSQLDESAVVFEDSVAPERSRMQKSESPAGLEDQRHGDSPAAAIETEAIRGADRQFLREAEDRARVQVGSDAESEAARNLAAPATASLRLDAAVERYCDEEQTADPNRWLECILDLESRGMPAAAMSERKLLQEAFPDRPMTIYSD